jgi:isocitrate dehydrogenase
MPNLYGDILSDVAAQIAGSVGLAGSANIGDHCAMFEAIHGSAPRRAGQNLANPSGLLLGAVLMLVHIDQPEVAERVHNGWLRTLEEGVHTYDIYTEGISKEKVGTKEFANAVIARLGKKPETFKPVSYAHKRPHATAKDRVAPAAAKTELVGVDIYLEWPSRNPEELAKTLKRVDLDGLALSIISNRGLKVWPDGVPETFCTDSFRCRFTAKHAGAPVNQRHIISLLERVDAAGLGVVKTESLRNFDGKPGFTLSQGE